MERIGELVDGIYDEVDGAERYAKRALKAKTDGEIAYAKTYSEMANQELGHADRLHDMAVSEIKLAEQQGREAPDGMRKVWDLSIRRHPMVRCGHLSALGLVFRGTLRYFAARCAHR